MREVTKSNQNFVTGEYFEQKVLKPVQAMRNTVTIQLHDAETGELVEEAITENAINDIYEGYAYGCIANGFEIKDNIFGWTSRPYFGSIVLSDSDIGELEDPFFIHGCITGLCNRTDTAGDAMHGLRGTYNAAESYEEVDENGYRHIHHVYDWSTAAANAKFQNIYWFSQSISWTDKTANYPEPRGSMTQIERRKYTSSGSISNSISSAYGFDPRGNLYKNVDGKRYIVENPLQFICGIEQEKLNLEESFFTDIEINEHFYKISYTTSGSGTVDYSFLMTIEKYDLAGNLVDTWTEDLVSQVPQLVEYRNNKYLYTSSSYNYVYWGGYYDPNGWVGLLTYYYTSSSRLPAIVSGELKENYRSYVACYSHYNVLTKKWLHIPNPWDSWCHYSHWYAYKPLKMIDNYMIGYNGANAVRIEITSNDVKGKEIAPDWVYPGSTSNPYYPTSIHPTLPIAVASYNGTYYFVAMRPITAQTRLAAPVNKTSLNTMKIQYDFYYKIPLTFMQPDHIWDLYKDKV